MENTEKSIFKHGVAEYIDHWLPMILAAGNHINTANRAYIMAFNYRKASRSKDMAEKIAQKDLDEILLLASNASSQHEKAGLIVKHLKAYHYYPSPGLYPLWKKEWELKRFQGIPLLN